MSSEPLVSASEQLAAVKALQAAGADNVDTANVGDRWFALDLEWYGQWKAAVGFNNKKAGTGKLPGPINNKNIASAQRLKDVSGLGKTWDIVPEVIWSLLVEWYGVESGSPVVARFVADQGGEKLVECSAPVFSLRLADEESGAEGRASSATLLVSKYAPVTDLPKAAVGALRENEQLSVEPAAENVRLWFRFNDAEDSDEEWKLVALANNTVMAALHEGDTFLGPATPNPGILVEVRNAGANWVRAFAAAPASRKRADSMDETSWRASLAQGDLLDAFDGKRWRESAVVAATSGNDDLVVRFRSEQAHRLTTARSAGADSKADAKLGDIAKPYTHVSDWRSQLRKDMKVEFRKQAQMHHYYCKETGIYLHYVRKHTEWWLSEKTQFDINKRHGYLNVIWDKPVPPSSDEKLWEIYVGNDLTRVEWADTDKIKVTVTPASAGNPETVTCACDPDLKESLGGARCKVAPAKISGTFVRVQGSWAKGTVKKIDYKKRTLVIITGGSYTYYYARRVETTREMSLDSDDIREVQFSGRGALGPGEGAGLEDAKPGELHGLVNNKLVGLRNLGNTCFMNSILQCLFSIRPLVEFFVDEELVSSQINTKNPLGTGGKLARAFSGLVRDIARAGHRSVVVPEHFKLTLGQFCSRFAGFQQQDCMEFFNSLTSDLLHEDLNRIIDKPYTDSVESGTDPDAVVAAESWRRFKLRNDSVIMDSMFGMYKSHLTCPNESCAGKSWRKFDPFVAVPCPLPPAPKVKAGIGVRVFTANAFQDTPTKEKNPAIFSVQLNCELTGSKIAENVSELTHIPIKNLFLIEIWKDAVYRCVFDAEAGVDARVMQADLIMAFELPKGFSPETHRMVEVRFMKAGSNSLLLLPLHKKASVGELKAVLWNMLKRRVVADKSKIKDQGVPEFVVGDMVEFESSTNGKIHGEILSMYPIYQLRKVRTKILDEANNVYHERYTDQIAHVKDFKGLAEKYFDTGSTERPYTLLIAKESPPQPTYAYSVKTSNIWKRPKPRQTELDLRDDEPTPDDLAMVVVRWNRDLHALQDGDFDELIKTPPVLESAAGAAGGGADELQVLNLDNCLKKFATLEQLGEMDTWYCPNCKNHVQAFKKMDLWALPDHLCFHLKRFSYEVGQWATHREKLEELVDFPYEIDMTPYLPPEALEQAQQIAGKPVSMLYELVAVSNHMGNLGFGHYTAYTKRGSQWFLCDDSRVVPVKASAVKTPAAYVLFYRRVTAESRAKSTDTDAALGVGPAKAAEVESKSGSGSPKLRAGQPPETDMGGVVFPPLDEEDGLGVD